ncbi:hypothetical protein GC722_08280 [Auraticoccus sp. F435]|uniref:Uncharacterized protein n=1 Tax=Auraticoccus cholistanensis TaxID=2656650 RepID=A0A6A9UTN3_9ACTN|nr:hypothetical protein [Auraticoccus cholistanensis]MVA76018.1 hypothetical protein [Auraticoccus cholistanensis]
MPTDTHLPRGDVARRLFPEVRELTRTMTVSEACRRTGVHRTPYLRWLARPCPDRELHHAYQVDVLFDALREDPHASVRTLTRRLAAAGLPADPRTVHYLREEARSHLPPPPPLPEGWTFTDAYRTLGIDKGRLRRMVQLLGMPDPLPGPGPSRWPEDVWRSLGPRLDRLVWRRDEVRAYLGRDRPGGRRTPLPPPGGKDEKGHWWLPAQVREWARQHDEEPAGRPDPDREDALTRP